MHRLGLPIAPLMCLTGASIDPAWQDAFQPLNQRIPAGTAAAQARRLHATFHGGARDRIAWKADLRWWHAEAHHDGRLAEALEGIDLAAIHGGPVGPAAPPPEAEPIPGLVEEVRWSGDPVRYRQGGWPGSQRDLRLVTPVGELHASERYASRCFGIHEYPVKGLDDLRPALWILEQRLKHARRSGAPSEWMGSLAPIQMLLVQLAGVEATAYLLADHRTEIEAAMRTIEELTWPLWQWRAGALPEAWSVENLSAEVSMPYWNRYLGPQLRRRSDLLHAKGTLYGVHHDGTLGRLLGRLSEAGVDMANGITCRPSGDLAYGQLRATAGDRLVLVDILPQILFTPATSEETFLAEIESAIRCFRDDPRVVFGIGDMLPVDGDIRRVETVVRMLEAAARPAALASPA